MCKYYIICMYLHVIQRILLWCITYFNTARYMRQAAVLYGVLYWLLYAILRIPEHGGGAIQRKHAQNKKIIT